MAHAASAAAVAAGDGTAGGSGEQGGGRSDGAADLPHADDAIGVACRAEQGDRKDGGERVKFS